jgi:hypothetical protein
MYIYQSKIIFNLLLCKPGTRHREKRQFKSIVNASQIRLRLQPRESLWELYLHTLNFTKAYSGTNIMIYYYVEIAFEVEGR